MNKIFTVLFFAVFITAFFVCCKPQKNTFVENTVNYEDYFDDIKGCAVFYNFNNGEYDFYNKEECNTRYSPNSTFKIAAVLEGLKYGVVKSEKSTMHYNGEKYPFESWERELNLKDAFQNSCVWYFRQVIDGVGQEAMEADLQKLNYGNCDVSEWKGSGIAPTEDTNGFWLGSSLKISPVEAVNVLADIFEGKTEYDPEHIDILKSIMESDVKGIYGKTGTGRDNSGWYEGFYESDSGRIYFAVHLENRDGKPVAGADAKAVACNIIENKYKYKQKH